MRRLLTAIAALGLILALAAPAFASDRVPTGVKKINVTLTFPPSSGGSKKAVRRTITKASTVNKMVNAADVLRTPQSVKMCPMAVPLGSKSARIRPLFIRLSPVLTVVFKGSSGQTLAQTRVQVVQGSHGTSGSTYCFPIDFTAGNANERLIGNSFVRLVGRMIGTQIS
jgi:hypothetical protein